MNNPYLGSRLYKLALLFPELYFSKSLTDALETATTVPLIQGIGQAFVEKNHLHIAEGAYEELATLSVAVSQGNPVTDDAGNITYDFGLANPVDAGPLATAIAAWDPASGKTITVFGLTAAIVDAVEAGTKVSDAHFATTDGYTYGLVSNAPVYTAAQGNPQWNEATQAEEFDFTGQGTPDFSVLSAFIGQLASGDHGLKNILLTGFTNGLASVIDTATGANLSTLIPSDIVASVATDGSITLALQSGDAVDTTIGEADEPAKAPAPRTLTLDLAIVAITDPSQIATGLNDLIAGNLDSLTLENVTDYGVVTAAFGGDLPAGISIQANGTTDVLTYTAPAQEEEAAPAAAEPAAAPVPETAAPAAIDTTTDFGAALTALVNGDASVTQPLVVKAPTLALYGALASGFTATDNGDGTFNVTYTAPAPAGAVAETALAPQPAAEPAATVPPTTVDLTGTNPTDSPAAIAPSLAGLTAGTIDSLTVVGASVVDQLNLSATSFAWIRNAAGNIIVTVFGTSLSSSLEGLENGVSALLNGATTSTTASNAALAVYGALPSGVTATDAGDGSSTLTYVAPAAAAPEAITGGGQQ